MLGASLTKHSRTEYIAWIDVETTGTNPERDEILEVGALVTDIQGRQIGPTYEALFSVNKLSSVISQTSENVQKMHERSGLWLDLWSRETQASHCVDKAMSLWFDSLCLDEQRVVYFGGNSITLDRNFVGLHLPVFYGSISHKSVDVTSLSIAIQSNSSVSGFKKTQNHRALSDANDSADEYRHYVRSINRISC